ncbi:MAG: caspase family protein [Acidimicrobiales bacterium]
MRRLVILVPLVVLGTVAGLAPALGAPPPDGERYALIVGIDRFQGATRPNTGGVGDAEDLKSALLAAGWPSANIRTLTDGGATASAIRDGLRWLADTSKENSFSVFAYSGHVKQTGSTEYLWPHDNQFIADTEMAGILRSVKGYLWTHIAGCEAAGFDENLSGSKRLVTAASQSYEKGYELPPEIRNSVFTYLLVEVGITRRQADANRDRRVSIQEAFRLAAERAPGLTAGQAQGAQHPFMAGGDGSDWFLDRPPPTRAAAPAAAPRCFLFWCT